MMSKKWELTLEQISDLCDIVDETYYGKTPYARIKAKRKLKAECKRLGITEDQAYAMYEE